MALFAGPIALYPRGCGQWESRAHRAALSLQRMDLHLTEFRDRRAHAGQKKGPGDGPPSPNNRAGTKGYSSGRGPENNVCRVSQLQH
jgi:hypothetical protein